jgi:Flp pilus assembly protein TadD
MLENIHINHHHGHPTQLPNSFHYLNRSAIIEGLSIDSTNELLLKTIYPNCDSFYYPTENKLKIARTLAISNPTLQNLVRYGRLLDQKDLCSEAIQFFEKALLKLPDNPEILFEIYKFLGNAYLKLGDIDSAEENYHKAFTIKPKSSLLHVNLGTLAIQRNEWHRVQFHFREALRYNINQDRAWTGLAIYHNYMGDKDLALANLKKALDLNSNNRTALLLLASWWPSHVPKDDLIYRLTQYLDQNPNDQDISMLLIKSAFENQDFHIAIIEIEKLVCLDPQNSLYSQMRQEIRGVLNESKSI